MGNSCDTKAEPIINSIEEWDEINSRIISIFENPDLNIPFFNFSFESSHDCVCFSRNISGEY